MEVPVPKSNDFDQETARRLLQVGGTLVVNDFPIGSEFGIDLSIHYTGERFIGIKMIPPGVHFIHYSLVNPQGQVAPRCGFFHCFGRGQLLVVRWDQRTEDIVVECNQQLVHDIKLAFNNGHLDNRLGAYQFSAYETWVSLTDYITTPLVDRISPSCGRIYSASSLVYEANQDGTITPKVDKQGVPDMVQSEDTKIRYHSQTPKHFLYPSNATPQEISEHSIDSSFTLEEMLRARNQQWTIMLGEMQFAFIAFLLGHQFEAFESWRGMVRLLCYGSQALHNHSDLYLAFIRVIYFQLKQTNEAVFADIVDNENVIFQCLRRFVLNVREAKQDGVDAELARRVERFAKSVSKSMKWPLDEEDYVPEDELPIVVGIQDDES